MTMHSHISHSVALSAPLLVAGLALVVLGTIGVAVVDPILTADPSAAPMVATMGAGIDELRMRLGPFLPTDFGGWVLTVAIFVTVWSIIKVIRELHGPVGGAGDGGALVSHGIRRAHIAIGVRTPAVVWGVVRDAENGHPLPLARIRLVGSDGVVLDSCVADLSGRYGFRLSHAETVERGYQANIEAQKSGHYFPPAGRAGVEHHANGVDVVMDCAHEGAHAIGPAGSDLWRLGSSAAFWAGVVFVPLAFMQSPDLLHGLMFTAFLGTGAVRAMWSRKS